eukprot:6036092-Alexandrium_andersonii.AAC.1
MSWYTGAARWLQSRSARATHTTRARATYLRLSLLTTARRANDGRGWTPRPTATTINYTTRSQAHTCRGETCPAAQPKEVTRRATDIGANEQAPANSQSTNCP